MSEPFRFMRRRLAPLYGEGEARAVALLVLEEAAGLSQTDVYGGKDRHIPEDVRERIANICKRIEGGEPVQYVLGGAWFMGRRFEVTPAVLIPRPETEELVAWAQTLYAGGGILDCGTGSGCIAVSLKSALPEAGVEAWDISPASLAVARRNAARAGAAVDFRERDMLLPSSWAGRSFGLIVSNPPYIPLAERAAMARHVACHEPAQALFVPDGDPLRFYRALAGAACAGALLPGGWLAVETHCDHARAVAALFRRTGLKKVELRQDQFGHDRMVAGQR